MKLWTRNVRHALGSFPGDSRMFVVVGRTRMVAVVEVLGTSMLTMVHERPQKTVGASYERP